MRPRYEMKNHRRQSWWALVLIAMTCGGLQAREVPRVDGPANAATRSVHGEAIRILNNIRTTVYQHDTKINESKGVYRCDCSGFVGYVLSRSTGKNDQKGPLSDGRKRPLAMDYEKFFAAAPSKADGTARWQHVVRLADALPGDVIAWRHEKPMPGNTGHVVIVDQRPVLEKEGIVRVVVIDSTTRPQVDDTRAKGTSGVGRGTMWFTIDGEGRPIGHIRGSRTSKPKIESISVGRALPPVEKPAARRAA